MNRFVALMATGLGLGKIPKAPGTFGTLLGIPLAYAVSFLPSYLALVITLIFVIFSVVIAELHERTLNEHDCQEIVIDEIAGYMVAMVWLPWTWQAVLGSFILFRIFDALKPFPINIVDKKVKGGLGVVSDDILAGIIANVILQAVYAKTNWLGVQWLG